VSKLTIIFMPLSMVKVSLVNAGIIYSHLPMFRIQTFLAIHYSVEVSNDGDLT
jgi:hypothetical protein